MGKFNSYQEDGPPTCCNISTDMHQDTSLIQNIVHGLVILTVVKKKYFPLRRVFTKIFENSILSISFSFIILV